MNFYIEITLLPCEEIDIYFLWKKLYQQIHLALVEQKDNAGINHIGISFPEYVCDLKKEHFKLGRKLRLFAKTEAELKKLNILRYLLRLTDYLHIKSIRSVPENISSYATFKRVQTKSSIDRLARRYAKYKDVNLDEAEAHYAGREESYSYLPYIRVNSVSSGQEYRLFIEKTEVNKPDNKADFSTYGLSSISTVPVFSKQ